MIRRLTTHFHALLMVAVGVFALTYVAPAHPPKSDPSDVFTTSALVPGEQAAGTVADTGCKMSEPA